MDGRGGGCIDGSMDGSVDGSVDGSMDRCIVYLTDRSIDHCKVADLTRSCTGLSNSHLLTHPPLIDSCCPICGRGKTLAPMYSECNLCRHCRFAFAFFCRHVSFFHILSCGFARHTHTAITHLSGRCLQMATELNPAELN